MNSSESETLAKNVSCELNVEVNGCTELLKIENKTEVNDT